MFSWFWALFTHSVFWFPHSILVLSHGTLVLYSITVSAFFREIIFPLRKIPFSLQKPVKAFFREIVFPITYSQYFSTISRYYSTIFNYCECIFPWNYFSVKKNPIFFTETSECIFSVKLFLCFFTELELAQESGTFRVQPWSSHCLLKRLKS